MAAQREVKLHVYDLSNGLARAMSQQLLGKQVDGIWHTGVVIGGIEYFFGQGIQYCPMSESPFGRPTRVLTIGQSEVGDAMLRDYLEDVQPRYNAATYDLLSNNCNTFSEELAQFLTGKSIPDYITGLPHEVAATPFGQMIIPMLQPALQQRLGNATASGFSKRSSPASDTIAEASAAVQVLQHTSSGNGSLNDQHLDNEELQQQRPQQQQTWVHKQQHEQQRNAATHLESSSQSTEQKPFNIALTEEFMRLQQEGIQDLNRAGAEAVKRVASAVQSGAVMPPSNSSAVSQAAVKTG